MKSSFNPPGIKPLFLLALLFISHYLLAFNWAGQHTGGLFWASDQAALYAAHPYVALPPSTEEAVSSGVSSEAAIALAPEPDQLRIVDLRGNVCYPQPNVLEICGAGDTLSLLLYTKSATPIQNIAFDLQFGDGIEYGLFVEASPDNATAATVTEVDVSDPSAPSFTVSEVTNTDAVVIHIGIRATCDYDAAADNPDIDLTATYTGAGGVSCVENLNLADIVTNVIAPDVAIRPISTQTLTTPATPVCQTVNVYANLANTSANSFAFTADNYGFADGIEISEVQVAGVVVAPSEYTIDPTTGALSMTVDNNTVPNAFGADGLMTFNEDIPVVICYQFTECLVSTSDKLPVYTALTLCDGSTCADDTPFNRTGRIRVNYNFSPTPQATYTLVQNPVLCSPEDYIFDVEISSDDAGPLTGALYSLDLYISSCTFSALGLNSIEIVGGGALDPSAFQVLSDGVTRVDLRGNNTVSGGGLSDLDGDTFFDDLAGDETLTLRFTFAPACEGGSTEPTCTAGTPGEICQISNIRVSAQVRCGLNNVNTNLPLPGAPIASSPSSATFLNQEGIDVGGVTSGYDFNDGNSTSNGNAGQFGINSAGDMVSAEQDISLQYNLGGADFFSCADGTDPDIQLVFVINGLEALVSNLDFSNVTIAGAAGTVISDVDEGGKRTITFSPDGPGTAGTTVDINFTAFVDTAICAPPQAVFVDALLYSACDPACACRASLLCQQVVFSLDPNNLDCCGLFYGAEISRASTGFTDETRADAVLPDDLTGPDAKRFVSGDTMCIVSTVATNPDIPFSGLNFADRQIVFGTYMAAQASGEDVELVGADIAALLDISLAQVASFTLSRADGTTIDLGPIFSGAFNQDRGSNGGVLIGSNDNPNVGSIFAGEATQPAFPNGGYTTNYSADPGAAGRILLLSLYNAPDGSASAIDDLLAVTGPILAEDTFRVEWKVPVIDNPNNAQDFTMQFSTGVSASQYNGDRLVNSTSGVELGDCDFEIDSWEYASPEIIAESRLDDIDGCGAELVVKFLVQPGSVPANWYADEFRPILGIEQFDIEFPASYYYMGGATWEMPGLGVTPYEPDATVMTIDTDVMGMAINYPAGDRGILRFVDAEFADGVRPEGYDGFFTGDDDVTTIGGTFPLLGVGGGVTDSLVFRIPLTRLCADAPTVPLTLTYDYSHKHLPSLNRNPFQTPGNTSGTTYYGQVFDGNDNPIGEGNNGRYFNLPRLGGEINHERATDRTETVDQFNGPTALISSVSIGDPLLADGAGTETNTYQLCPPAGESLAPGTLVITVDNTASLVSISGDATSFTAAGSTDSTNLFTVVIPSGLAIDDCFDLTLETDLLSCAEGQVCLSALLGCDVGTVSPTKQAALLAALGVTCDAGGVCYSYDAGTAEAMTSFLVPTDLRSCTPSSFSVVFNNTGTGDLSNFMPTIFIPEGLLVTPGSYMLTGPAGTVTLSEMAAPAADGALGAAVQFSQASVDAGLAGGIAAPGDVITITFMAETSCDFSFGTPFGAGLEAIDECNGPYALAPMPSGGIFVIDAGIPTMEISVDAASTVTIDCEERSIPVVLSAVNLSKIDDAQLVAEFIVPAGVSLSAADVEVISPAGFTLTDADIMTISLGDGRDSISFNGPATLGFSEIFCVRANLTGDLFCGTYDLSAALFGEVEIDCNGTVCMIPTELRDAEAFQVEATCEPMASITSGQTICSTAALNLSMLGASYSPVGFMAADGTPFLATWTTSGSGTFDGDNPDANDMTGDFATATTYTPSAADVAAGQVTLTLTTDDPTMAPFNAIDCGPEMDEVTITILNVDCGSFFWNGND